MPLDLIARQAFLSAAEGRLKLETAASTRHHKRRRLYFTGFHEDATPFVVACAPFIGDPLARARQMARDVLQTHTGVVNMPAPAAIKGLAATLREQLTAATARASALGEKAKSEVANLNAVLTEGESVVKEVSDAAAEVKAALGLSTNGGPAGPLET